MSKTSDPGSDGSLDLTATPVDAPDSNLAALRKESRRLDGAETDPRRDRWPANDYY